MAGLAGVYLAKATASGTVTWTLTDTTTPVASDEASYTFTPTSGERTAGHTEVICVAVVNTSLHNLTAVKVNFACSALPTGIKLMTAGTTVKVGVAATFFKTITIAGWTTYTEVIGTGGTTSGDLTIGNIASFGWGAISMAIQIPAGQTADDITFTPTLTYTA